MEKMKPRSRTKEVEDLTGKKFGRLTVLGRAADRYDKDGKVKRYWLCECDCGTQKEVRERALKEGTTKSCGCLQKEKLKITQKNNVKDLTGQKFGHLTPKYYDPNYINKNGKIHPVWWCECDCGNPELIPVSSNNLKGGHTTRCNKCPKYEDLTGMKFGRWTVLYRTDDYISPKGHHIIMWMCQCECGTIRPVAASQLKSGESKSCGCLHREIVSNIASNHDMIGKRFGRLVVKEEAGVINGVINWLCDCDCGNEVITSGVSLRGGVTRSCGCLQKDRAKEVAKKRRTPFKYEIGQVVKTNIGSITITDRFRDEEKDNGKFYLYDCNICGYHCDKEHAINEHTLNKGHGCSICGGGNAVQKGINDIGTTAPWMIPWFKNPEDADIRSIGNRDVIDFKCPYCGYEFQKRLSNAYSSRLNCPLCDDGYKYPEKFMMSFLTQLGVNYKFQLTKTTFKWCDKYKYDFYLTDYNTIIETHGEQHYFNKGAFKITVEEQQGIDRIKEDLAIKNNVKYIVIDCRYSKLDWVKNSIIQQLGNLFDLSNIDWNKCQSDALKSLVKEICDYYMNNNKPSTIELNNIFHIRYSTIGKYLKQGAEIGWCDYDPKVALQNSRKKNKNIKRLEAWYKDEYLGTFDCANDFIDYVKNNYNIKLCVSSVRNVCYNNQSETKGFKCQYV